MYVIGIIVVFIYLIWAWLGRKEQIGEDIHTILSPFYRMASYLYKKICIRKIRVFSLIQVKKDLEELYPGENSNLLLTEYYIKKITHLIIIFLIGTLISIVIKSQTAGGGRISPEGVVKRGNYKEGIQELYVEADMGKGNKQEITITMSERKLNRSEADELEVKFWGQICEEILGENISLENVTYDLFLLDELENFPFIVSWDSSAPQYISKNGVVTELSKGEEAEVIMTAMVTYEDWVWLHELPVRVLPPLLTEEEQIRKELEMLVEELEAASTSEELWMLPKEFEGQTISWKEKTEDNSLLFWCIWLAAVLGIYFLIDKDLHTNLIKRRKQMKQNYPQIINKMVLYLGAGMTIRGAFEKISLNYSKEKKKTKERNPAYEEMIYTCHELRAGVSESIAYERFGKRSGTQEYVRFCTLLIQNLKKGNSALLKRLREESVKAVQEQINVRKQVGEEATTKLLVPMIMMLGIVMVLVMIPAFSSFGI